MNTGLCTVQCFVISCTPIISLEERPKICLANNIISLFRKLKYKVCLHSTFRGQNTHFDDITVRKIGKIIPELQALRKSLVTAFKRKPTSYRLPLNFKK